VGHPVQNSRDFLAGDRLQRKVLTDSPAKRQCLLPPAGEGSKRELYLLYSLLEEVPAAKFYKQLYKILQIKVKVILEQATKVHRLSRGIVLLLL
jgi:hypothetical protein